MSGAAVKTAPGKGTDLPKSNHTPLRAKPLLPYEGSWLSRVPLSESPPPKKHPSPPFGGLGRDLQG